VFISFCTIFFGLKLTNTFSGVLLTPEDNKIGLWFFFFFFFRDKKSRKAGKGEKLAGSLEAVAVCRLYYISRETRHEEHGHVMYAYARFL
jgi:hypothetical protein